MAELSQTMHAKATKDLLASGKYSDLTITCGPNVHEVHKAIVCARCGFFERAEHLGKEAAENLINHPADSPRTIALLLQFLYTGDYDPVLAACPNAHERQALRVPEKWKLYWPHTCARNCKEWICDHHTCDQNCNSNCNNMVCNIHCPAIVPGPDEGPEQLLRHSEMYEIGDKYDVPGLKELASEKFSRACSIYWDDDAFAEAAEHAYATTPYEDLGLRDCVRVVLKSHRGIISKPNIRAFLQQ